MTSTARIRSFRIAASRGLLVIAAATLSSGAPAQEQDPGSAGTDYLVNDTRARGDRDARARDCNRHERPDRHRCMGEARNASSEAQMNLEATRDRDFARARVDSRSFLEIERNRPGGTGG